MAGGRARVLVPLLKPDALARYVQLKRQGDSGACLLGLDVGGSKVGLALADRTLAFARPLGRIDRRPDRPFADFPAQVARRLAAVVKERHVAGLVVGYPLELWTGQAGERCREVFAFMERVYQHQQHHQHQEQQPPGEGPGALPPSPLPSSSPSSLLPPFALWDERMTTQEARDALGAMAGPRMRKGRQAAAEDPVAASIILQGFLDQHLHLHDGEGKGKG